MSTQQFSVWRSFDFDMADREPLADRLAGLRQVPFGITMEAERVVEGVHTVSCHSGGTVNFGRVSCHDLGCEKASYPEFIELVVEMGIHLCTFAHVLLLRRNFLDQVPGSFVSMAMEPVVSSLGQPSFFILVRRGGDGDPYLLDASSTYPFAKWYPDAKFVVVLPPTFQ